MESGCRISWTGVCTLQLSFPRSLGQTHPDFLPRSERSAVSAFLLPTSIIADGMIKQRQRLSRLILTGFMGAGKSTVGAILARDLGWRFLDLDAAIEASSKLTVAEIFRDHGEANFRDRERQAVQQLNTEEKIVLALGGGTVEDKSTRSLLIDSPGNCLVFLAAELPELMARCTVEGKVRPLLAAPEALEARHARRLPHYRAAHVTVTTTGLTPQLVADRVRELVSVHWLIDAKER
jgi:shikimate kinase